MGVRKLFEDYMRETEDFYEELLQMHNGRYKDREVYYMYMGFLICFDKIFNLTGKKEGEK